jgi:hypothetical protein
MTKTYYLISGGSIMNESTNYIEPRRIKIVRKTQSTNKDNDNKEKIDTTISEKQISNDEFSFEIFNFFVKKHRLDGYFEKAEADLKFKFTHKKMTVSKYNEGLAAVDKFKKQFDKIVNDVTEKRIFYEKASSGSGPRSLKTPRDWSDVIIELNDFVAKFKDIMSGLLKHYSKPEEINKECEKSFNDRQICPQPCNIKSSFGKKSCKYE